MTNAEMQAGSLFIVGFHGHTVSAALKTLITRYHVAGVILFARNIDTPAQLVALTNALQATAQAAGYAAPLLIALDQENGVIRRLTNGVSLQPGAMTLAATGQPANAAVAYGASAEELAALGVNWDLAPDADVNNNPANPVIGVRSFGERPETVAQFVQQAVQGLQTHGVAACLKHFPGHGNTAVDSHLALPVLRQSRAALAHTELVPFQAGLQAGAAAVMVAHIQFPALDAQWPASLSPVIMTDLLRRELGFDGVVVTDDLEMQAIAAHYGTPAACVQALASGADLVMVSHVYATQQAALAQVAAAIAAGTLPAARVAQAAKRVLALRQRVGHWHTAFAPAAFAQLVAAHSQTAARLYQQGVTLVQAPAQPLRTAPVVIAFGHQQDTQVVERQALPNPLLPVARQIWPAATGVTLDLTAAAPAAALPPLTPGQPLVVGTTNIQSSSDQQAQVITQLVAQGHPVHVIALRNPYDLKWLPPLASYTAAYEPTPAALKLALAALAGQGRPQGQLPVVIS